MVFGLGQPRPLGWRKWGLAPHFDACFFQVGEGGKFEHLSRFRKAHHFRVYLAASKSSHKSPNFLRSRLWRSQNSFLVVLIDGARKIRRSINGCVS